MEGENQISMEHPSGPLPHKELAGDWKVKMVWEVAESDVVF